MITVPIDVRCNFCTKTFCCLKCRVNHEKNEHQNEINAKIREEYLKSICYICRGEQLPVKMNEMLSSELIQHISEEHLPLKCNKCSKIFENINDFQLIGKCCSVKSVENEEILDVIGEEIDKPSPKVDINGNEEALTPLTKINLRWRRKSKEFLHKSEDSHIKHDEPLAQNPLKRQTSTPMQANFDSLSSMQISSINCVSSSSETDLSPPAIPQKPLVVLSPKSKKKSNSPASKSRPKLPVQNTPLRQVMTKSIQRAMATHGHYKHVHLQQRKMTFDSSSSSNEPTMSLMKLQVESEEHDSNLQPLDLRLSPAIRRNGDVKEFVREVKSESISHVEYEEIQVIFRRSDSDSSSLTSYKSCYSDNATPKGSSSNIFKKTISFENPENAENSPGFLVPTRSFNSSNNDESDVFYTPRTTPFRRVKSLDLTDVKPYQNNSTTSKNSSNIWSFVTSVMGSLVTGTKKEQQSSASTENKKKWGFNFKAAANYFGKYNETLDESDKSSIIEEEEVQVAQKRPRTIITSPNENSENTISNSITSPTCKRRKIQGRKPIERMRKLP